MGVPLETMDADTVETYYKDENAWINSDKELIQLTTVSRWIRVCSVTTT